MILAISPAVKGFGYAILKNEHEAIDIGRANFKYIHSDNYLKRAIKLINYYEPTELIIECKNDPSQEKKSNQKFFEILKSYTSKKGIVISRYNYEQIKNAFAQYEVKTRIEISLYLAKAFPQYTYRKPDKRAIWMSQPHTLPMFNALSLGIAHLYYSK